MEPGDFLSQIRENFSSHPDRRAFYIAETGYTYGELSALVAEIQQRIKQTTGGDEHVGVCLGDDIQTYASILALWMSGIAFVPVNPLFPVARNRKIIEQTGLKLILHSSDLEQSLLIPGCRSISTGTLVPDSGRIPELDDFQREKDAYVLFTSGSTGNPKGVRISFHNLNAFVRDFIHYPAYSLSSEDRFLQLYDLSFDGSLPCYVVPLSVGASVFTVPPDGIKYLAAYKLMLEQELTFIKMPPSTLSYLRPYFSSIHLPAVRYCLFGGEAFPALLAGEFESCIPNALIQNVYGPTEAAIISLIYDWNGVGSSRKELDGIVSIGEGYGTNNVLVLGEEGKAAEPGEAGELLVSGDQVSPGYWNNPGLNETAFVDIDWEGELRRFYHTGDMVIRDTDGDVMYIGRNDEQVQVRGYRVELGEIESLARDFLNGTGVMALGRDHGAGEMKIYLAVESDPFDTAPLKDHLEKHLPPYMIPEEVVSVSGFPRLVSGKLDRRAINDLLPS